MCRRTHGQPQALLRLAQQTAPGALSAGACCTPCLGGLAGCIGPLRMHGTQALSPRVRVGLVAGQVSHRCLQRRTGVCRPRAAQRVAAACPGGWLCHPVCAGAHSGLQAATHVQTGLHLPCLAAHGLLHMMLPGTACPACCALPVLHAVQRASGAPFPGARGAPLSVPSVHCSSPYAHCSRPGVTRAAHPGTLVPVWLSVGSVCAGLPGQASPGRLQQRAGQQPAALLGLSGQGLAHPAVRPASARVSGRQHPMPASYHEMPAALLGPCCQGLAHPAAGPDQHEQVMAAGSTRCLLRCWGSAARPWRTLG